MPALSLPILSCTRALDQMTLAVCTHRMTMISKWSPSGHCRLQPSNQRKRYTTPPVLWPNLASLHTPPYSATSLSHCMQSTVDSTDTHRHGHVLLFCIKAILQKTIHVRIKQHFITSPSDPLHRQTRSNVPPPKQWLRSVLGPSCCFC